MALQPWYKVVYPREDLREGRPLDASEFAVHLDQVRDKRAPEDYQKPERFFSRTFLTKNLAALAGEAVRRLSGVRTEASAVFNMSTQFGGGKTHALTLLYHIAQHGPAAKGWPGVETILQLAGVPTVPKAAVAVFVGTEFDSLTGRGGDDGTPRRFTTWGEIAWQLGKETGFKSVEQHDKERTAPSGEVIRQILPKDKPCLILMDELMNYVGRNRKSGLAAQFHSFLQNLSEEARGQERVVLVASVPKSDLEMTSEDHADFDRLKKLLDRLGKPVIMSSESEAAEIIRRRLFEWDGPGSGGLTRDAEKTVAEYADWVNQNRSQLPGWFSADNARDAFRASYPFHPALLSVFERKWQALPRFQQTRGVLRLLALWVSKAYQDGYKGAHCDPLIGLGTAPLEESMFRTALFEQLGEGKLEGAVTTDIAGKRDSHADRLDKEAVEEIKKARLHRKITTAILFESNGGQAKAEATVPEIRLAVGEPGLDIGHTETVLETLATSCYYLSVERNRYRFSVSANLNKILSDRQASITPARIDERVREEVQKVFGAGNGVERVFFPEKSNAVADRPVLTLAVLAPEYTMEQAEEARKLALAMTRDCGRSGRTYKSAVVWCVAESASGLREEARKLLALEDIKAEEDDAGETARRLDDAQMRQLAEQLKRSKRDLSEKVFQTYKNLLVLGKGNELRHVDLGLINSSQAPSLSAVILKRLSDEGDLETDGVSANFLLRRWPSTPEWTTRALRDAFFASPEFPRLLKAESLKDTIARGVSQGLLAYVGLRGDRGGYEPFVFGQELSPEHVEISNETCILTAEEATKHIEPKKLTSILVLPPQPRVRPGESITLQAAALDQHGKRMEDQKVTWEASGGKIDASGRFRAGSEEGEVEVTARAGEISGSTMVTVAKEVVPPAVVVPQGRKIRWSGEVPSQKWMNFYTKVLARFATDGGLRITVSFEVTPDGGVSPQRTEETKTALRELGLGDELAS